MGRPDKFGLHGSLDLQGTTDGLGRCKGYFFSLALERRSYSTSARYKER
jgi:hypothetical protein